ncbi:MAG: hypothetical protein AAF384_06165 [Pseudomonadota bacterium]
MNRFVCLTLLALLPLCALAQHSDVWVTLDSNQVTISPTNLETLESTLVDTATGRFLFLGDFGDLSGGPQGTDDPGYQAQSGTFQALSIFNYRGVGQLEFWDGASWVTSVPDQEQIIYTDALSSTTTWSTSGVTTPEGAIDQISPDGSIHSHLDFTIDNNGSAPAAGAYLVDIEFFATSGVGGPVVHTSSAPVRVALNYQLSQTDFDAAIDALTTATSTASGPVRIPALPLTAACLLGALLSYWGAGFTTRRS